MRLLLAPSLLVLMAWPAAAADEGPHDFSGADAVPFRAFVVPGPHGTLGAWLDYHDTGPEVAVDLYTTILGDDLRPVGAPQRIPIPGRYVGWEYPGVMRIVPVQDGWLALLQAAARVSALKLDASGRPAGPLHDAYTSADFASLRAFDAAPSSSGAVITIPEWYGVEYASSVDLDPDGWPRGDRIPLVLNADGAYLDHCPVANDGGQLVSAWYWAVGAGLQLRELGPDGRPRGAPIDLAEGAACPSSVAVAATRGHQIVAFASGCEQTDAFLVSRDRQGLVRGPFAIASEPTDEGRAPLYPPVGGIMLASRGDRAGVLYTYGPDGAFKRWMFAEFDAEGVRHGPLRDLYEEFGAQGNYLATFTYDEARDRWIVGYVRFDGTIWRASALALVPSP